MAEPTQPRDDDAGYSLVELLVVMAIFTGLLTIVFAVLITVQKQTRDNLGRDEQVQQAELGLAQIDRQVRSGNVITVPAACDATELANSMRVYTQTDGVRRCVQWQIFGGTLRYRSWDPGWTPGSAQPAWQVVARELLGSSSFARSTSGTADQSVKVHLELQAEEADGKPVVVETVLFGRNTVYGYPADICRPVPPE